VVINHVGATDSSQPIALQVFVPAQELNDRGIL
jgi:hypothetical protein